MFPQLRELLVKCGQDSYVPTEALTHPSTPESCSSTVGTRTLQSSLGSAGICPCCNLQPSGKSSSLTIPNTLCTLGREPPLVCRDVTGHSLQLLFIQSRSQQVSAK